jgi:penicillin-binding protein 2
VTSIAALEEDSGRPATATSDGQIRPQGYIDKEFYDYAAHGTLDMYWRSPNRAACISTSSVQDRATIILKYADYFGLVMRGGVDLPGEIAGFSPRSGEAQTFGQHVVRRRYGQSRDRAGFIAVTCIEMANLVAESSTTRDHEAPSGEGVPLVDNRRSSEGTRPRSSGRFPSPPAGRTRQAGHAFVGEERYTGRLGSLKVQAAGKTGTAQTRSRRREDYSQHAWFVGYAPFDAPADKVVAIAVFVEYGVAGAVAAVPVAERVFSKLCALGYF